jgi:prepilin-type N-terminal cleavage/methylation domain-containing protein
MRSVSERIRLAAVEDGAYTMPSAISPRLRPRGHLSPQAMPCSPDTLSRKTTSAFGARARRSGGFSLVELLVVILILGVLMGITIAVVTRVRSAAANTSCLANLSQIAMAFQQYATSHKGRLPDPLASDTSFEQALSQYVSGGASAFRCPADEELFDMLGSSYDWRDTPDADTTLAGKPLAAARGNAILTFEALPGWHQKGKINAATCGGAVMTMDRDTCLADLDKPVQ